MTVLIDIRTEGFPEELEAVMEKIALDSLKYEGFQEECEISISIVDNEEIHQINKQFRGIDRPTDVLSFPQLTFEEGEIMDRNENGEVVLGDIIISLERAREQAEEYGHSLKREIAFLTAHSMLHLLGYDHLDEGPMKARMRAREEAILEGLGITRETEQEAQP